MAVEKDCRCYAQDRQVGTRYRSGEFDRKLMMRKLASDLLRHDLTLGASRLLRSAKIAAMREHGRRSSTAQRNNLERRKAIVAWSDDGSLDGVDFKRDILPKLQGLPGRRIADAMGASISHGSKVRNGHLIPHPRHWGSLTKLV